MAKGAHLLLSGGHNIHDAARELTAAVQEERVAMAQTDVCVSPMSTAATLLQLAIESLSGTA